MDVDVWTLLILAGILPLARAGWANRRTALAHAWAWAVAAWAAWTWCATTKGATAGYVAVGLTACAGVAVLGARRPGVAAWHGVVAGLLVTLLVPLAQDFLIETSWLSGVPWRVFVGVTVAVGVLNYLPTRAGFGALTLFAACAVMLYDLGEQPGKLVRTALALAAVAPWLAWGPFLWWPETGRDTDRLWRDFRDRFGFTWTARVREQFHLAARHAGWSLELTASGLRRPDGSPPDEREEAAGREILTALIRRFGAG